LDCWSDDGEVPSRPGGVRRPERYYRDDAASDTSLHSCHSADAVKQWTTATDYSASRRGPATCRSPSTSPAARASRRRRRRTSAGGEDERRQGGGSSSEMLDADNDQINNNRRTSVIYCCPIHTARQNCWVSSSPWCELDITRYSRQCFRRPKLSLELKQTAVRLYTTVYQSHCAMVTTRGWVFDRKCPGHCQHCKQC